MWSSYFKHGKYISEQTEKADIMIKDEIKKIDQLIDINQAKVWHSFQKNGVSDYHFAASTGYGYDDAGRDTLEKVYSDVFKTEAAIVRPHIVSGTHAISIGLYGALRPGDQLVYLTGNPYDTLEQVIGVRGEGMGSLIDYGVRYDVVPLTTDGKVDYSYAKQMISNRTKVVAIQRSRGYDWRPSFTTDDIGEMVQFVKSINPNAIIFVDNCYGEFTEMKEPTEVGVDMMAGSLIKNPGGGLVVSGGYVVGRKDLIEKAGYRLTAPGIGSEGGAMFGGLRELFQGFFLAPHVVGQALKGAVFAAAMLEQLGFVTHPSWDDKRTDIIQAVRLGTAESLIAFCQGIQKAAPVDSHVVPQPSGMPGYNDRVIMAAGTFIQGASIELSADGPLREPYAAYLQGGLTYSHARLGIWTVIDNLLSLGLMDPHS